MAEGKRNDFFLFLLAKAEEIYKPNKHFRWYDCILTEKGNHLRVGRMVELLFNEIDLEDIKNNWIQLHNLLLLT